MGEEMTEGTPKLDAQRWQIANRRFREETGGTTVAGTRFSTDRESQAMTAGAVLAARIAQDNGEPFSINWKCPGGDWTTIDAATMVAVGEAARAHVQACFNREAELLAAVEAGDYSDTDLGTGWPQ